MAFNVRTEHGEADTIKDDEYVVVQTVDVSNRFGDVTTRIEARLNIDKADYTGPTKTALVFSDPEDARAVGELLIAAADAFAPAKVEPITPRRRTRKSAPAETEEPVAEITPKRAAGVKKARRRVGA